MFHLRMYMQDRYESLDQDIGYLRLAYQCDDSLFWTALFEMFSIEKEEDITNSS